jgi:diaminopimelate epimerase
MENSNLNSVEVKTLGGNLKVEFQKKSNLFSNVFLSGPSSFVFSGEINI